MRRQQEREQRRREQEEKRRIEEMERRRKEEEERRRAEEEKRRADREQVRAKKTWRKNIRTRYFQNYIFGIQMFLEGFTILLNILQIQPFFCFCFKNCSVFNVFCLFVCLFFIL